MPRSERQGLGVVPGAPGDHARARRVDRGQPGAVRLRFDGEEVWSAPLWSRDVPHGAFLPLALQVEHRVVDADSEAAAVAWWEQLVADGGEGTVDALVAAIPVTETPLQRRLERLGGDLEDALCLLRLATSQADG